VVVNRYPITYWMRLFPFPRPLKNAATRVAAALGGNHLSFPLPAGNVAVVGFKPTDELQAGRLMPAA
jgi:hypothetical protein